MPRKRLATELRRLRDQSGRTLEQVAEELLISTSKLSRLENAQGSPQARDVRDLIKLYRVEGTELAERLHRWVRSARDPGWWHDYSDILPGDMDVHIAYETEASVARVYTLPVLPVLLRTPDYARALYRSMEPWRTADEIDRLVRLREGRQTALVGRNGMAPLRLVAVAHESALRQRVGSDRIMHAQLGALLDWSERGNIELRVLPFATPLPPTAQCGYAYFEFTDTLDRDVIAIETHAGFRYLESPEAVAAYQRHYQCLLDAALPVPESRALIRSVQSGLSAGQPSG
jgi:transcriptional regulator with XRE-family HTH domain